MLKEGLPRGTYLNLNVPGLPRVKGIAICRQADGRWIKEFYRTERPDGKTGYQLAGEFMNLDPAGTDDDTQRLDEGYASLVPGRIDVTDYGFLETLKQWDLRI
jgi:5'-nucleotidase